MDREKFRPKELPEDLITFVQIKERELFPEFEEQGSYMAERGTGDTASYFCPSHHFRRGLITKEVLTELLGGKNAVSFGAGKAHLEQLLVRGLGVRPEQIILCDSNTRDLPQGFQAYQCDILGDWPDFERKIDYVLFPESLFIALSLGGIQRGHQTVEAVARLITRCFDNVLGENGEIRADGHGMKDDELSLLKQELAKTGISLEYNSSLLVVRKNQRNIS